jgi:hypothetical protein
MRDRWVIVDPEMHKEILDQRQEECPHLREAIRVVKETWSEGKNSIMESLAAEVMTMEHAPPDPVFGPPLSTHDVVRRVLEDVEQAGPPKDPIGGGLIQPDLDFARVQQEAIEIIAETRALDTRGWEFCFPQIGEVPEDLDDVIKPYGQKVAQNLDILGLDHPQTLVSENNLACLQEALGDTNEALCLYEVALYGCKRILGEDDSTTRVVEGNRDRARLHTVGAMATPEYLGELRRDSHNDIG